MHTIWNKPARASLLAIWALALCGGAMAQDAIRVSQLAWNGLAPSDKKLIQQRYIVELAAPDTFATVVDNPGVDESTPATTIHADKGAAQASADYLDKAEKEGNYSRAKHRAAELAGRAAGAALDTPAKTQFRFNYTLQFADGSIKSYQQVRRDRFGHALGTCILVPEYTVSDEPLCNQTAAALRTAYFPRLQPQPSVSARAAADKGQVMCQLGTIVAASSSAEKCQAAQGRVVQ
ncbi:hypothetical protein [Janthinobacterium agaricidamnosum]|uniref:Uncharacterized protein n=1 Tax=Janthinobacterium agaricidamnosum NBRC 102515 = DSM 9628 TaxID=1349767 RepID=W0UZN0_9BURK|nr:hypothetical protein [Janthinobacterium agaricidamnosum]CDG80835.1 hypothetical protein GJA_172 [Janthinobacterium agaricidamnosum NBRC 102515 = DSM 9628]